MRSKRIRSSAGRVGPGSGARVHSPEAHGMDRVFAPRVRLGIEALPRIFLGAVSQEQRMCGIVGLLVKKPHLREQLGALMVPMLTGMTERGPDSAGLAVYTTPVSDLQHKLSLYSGARRRLVAAARELSKEFGERTRSPSHGNQAVLTTAATPTTSWRGWRHAPVGCGALGGPVDRLVQGRGRAGRDRRRYRFKNCAARTWSAIRAWRPNRR
jgi:hypothetical protein